MKSLRELARIVAAEVKAVIATENLHVVCNANGQIALSDEAGYGWMSNAEERIAQTVAFALLDAERRALTDVSSDALVAELKSRHDLFFMVATPNTPEEFQWRRGVKGAAYPLMGFVTMQVNGVLAQMAIGASALEIFDEDVLSNDEIGDPDEWVMEVEDEDDEDIDPPSGERLPAPSDE